MDVVILLVVIILLVLRSVAFALCVAAWEVTILGWGDFSIHRTGGSLYLGVLLRNFIAVRVLIDQLAALTHDLLHDAIEHGFQQRPASRQLLQ
jgi:hypothetical protein